MEKFDLVYGDKIIMSFEVDDRDEELAEKLIDCIYQVKEIIRLVLPDEDCELDILARYSYDEDEDDDDDCDGCPYDDCEDCTFYCDEGMNRKLSEIEFKLKMIKILASSVTDSVKEYARHYDPVFFENGEQATRFYAIPGEVEETVDDFVSQMELSVCELKESAEDYSAE